MKKYVWLTMLLMIGTWGMTAQAAGTGTTYCKGVNGCSFVDANHDGICDNADAHCSFVDANHDGICDNGDAHCNFIDENHDGVCDNKDTQCEGNSQQCNSELKHKSSSRCDSDSTTKNCETKKSHGKSGNGKSHGKKHH